MCVVSFWYCGKSFNYAIYFNQIYCLFCCPLGSEYGSRGSLTISVFVLLLTPMNNPRINYLNTTAFSHQRVLHQRNVIFSQSKPSHSFQCYSTFKTWSIIHFAHHLLFHFIPDSFIYHELEGLKGSGFAQNNHQRVLCERNAVVRQGKTSHLFQCYLTFERWSIINLDHHLLFNLLTASFISPKQEGLRSSGFAQNSRHRVLRRRTVITGQGNPHICLNAIQFSKHEVSFILITISCYMCSPLISYLRKHKYLEALVLPRIVVTAFFVSRLL